MANGEKQPVVEVHTKGGAIYRSYGDGFVLPNYVTAPQGAQMGIANALLNGGGIGVERVTVDGEEVEYTHPAVQALGKAVFERICSRVKRAR